MAIPGVSFCFAYGQVLATSVGYKASRVELISSYLSLRDVFRWYTTASHWDAQAQFTDVICFFRWVILAFFGFLPHEALLAIILSFSQELLVFFISFLLLI